MTATNLKNIARRIQKVKPFLHRHELFLRSTTLFKLDDTLTIKRTLSFKPFVDGIDFSKYQLRNIIAMDETAVFMNNASQTIIDEKSATSIFNFLI